MAVPRITFRQICCSPGLPRTFSSSQQVGERGGERGKPTKSIDAATILENENKGVFRVMQIEPPKFEKQERQFGGNKQFGGLPPPIRSASMKPDQAWDSVWPAARTFHPATVPLPVRQGVVQVKNMVVPSKWANAELMKIPNFLHLTPPVIKKHCTALKRFCTAWPSGLETEDDIVNHFPLTVTTSDHLNSSSSIRDRRARIVTFKFPVDSLQLDQHARDKFLRLVGERYNEETGEVTLTADRCPYRGQNQDYASYLLTALFHESWSVEEWEVDKGEADQEVFSPEEKQEREALVEILNKGEDENSILRYKEEVRKILGLPEQVLEPEVVT
jgi:small subunit ribosomal protein S35